MLEESQKVLLVGMSEVVFYLNRDIKELKFENESLKKKLATKEEVMKFQLEQIEKLTLEKNELSKKLNETPDDYQKLKNMREKTVCDNYQQIKKISSGNAYNFREVEND